MAKDFKIISQFSGYQNKKDITNVDTKYLAPGSRNVLINDGEKIVSSPGYTLDGPEASEPTGGSMGKFDWTTSKDRELHGRVLKSGIIQYRYTDADGNVTYRDLYTFDANTRVRFLEEGWWSSTEVDDMLLFVAGDTNLYVWSGGITTVASTTSNSITKAGDTYWKEEKFTTTGHVIIDGVRYTYTGGANSKTLTGVTPDPSTITAGEIAHQDVEPHNNIISSSYNVNYIGMNKNQVYLGSKNYRDVYVSHNDDYLTYTFSSNRIPGEGALLTLDAPCAGFVPQEDAMYIAAGNDMWFQTQFTLSSDNTNEALTIIKLKSGPLQGTKSQELITKIKNSIIYVTNEPTLDTLGRVENINTPQSVPLSDPIKKEFKKYDFTDGNTIFYESQTFISLPAEGLVLIYDHQNNYWQAPQTLSVVLSVIEGRLYGHSTSLDESYLLFDTSNYTHNGNPIESTAVLSYNSFGNRSQKKTIDEYYWEGYATRETKINITYNFDYQGSTKKIENRLIDMSNSKIVFNVEEDSSIGHSSLGKNPLGSITDNIVELPKFRTIQTMNKQGFYEMQEIISTNTERYNWEIIAHGPNAMLSTAESLEIKT